MERLLLLVGMVNFNGIIFLVQHVWLAKLGLGLEKNALDDNHGILTKTESTSHLLRLLPISYLVPCIRVIELIGKREKRVSLEPAR